MISLAWVGNCEVRMHDAPSKGPANGPLFQIDVFDHDWQQPIENRVCHDVEEGIAAFEALVSR
jgi:hypothetical protein